MTGDDDLHGGMRLCILPNHTYVSSGQIPWLLELRENATANATVLAPCE